MLECGRIDVSKGIEVNMTNTSNKCDICHYWYFLDNGCKYQPYICHGCQDLMQKSMNFNDLAIVSIKWCNYKIQCWYISKDDAINIKKKSNWNEKSGLL